VNNALVIGLGQIGMGYDLTADTKARIATLARAFNEHPYFNLVAGVGVGPSYKSLWPPVPLRKMVKAVVQAFNELGWHWWPSYSVINTSKSKSGSSCINIGPCNTGCPQSAKGSVDATYLPLTESNGVEIYTECRVHEVTLDSKGLTDGVFYTDADGVKRHFKANIVILAVH